MSRSPRSATVPLLSFDKFVWCVVQGAAALIATGALFLSAIKYGLPANQARALVFGSLIASTIALVLINRTFEASVIAAFSRPNPTLWIMLAAATILFTVILRWTPMRQLFDFGDFHGHDILISGGIGLALLLVLEAMKYIYLKRERP